MTDSAGGVGGSSGGGGFGGDSVGDSSNMSGDNMDSGFSGDDSSICGAGRSIGGMADGGISIESPTTGDQLANSPTTADDLCKARTDVDALCSSPTTAEQLANGLSTTAERHQATSTVDSAKTDTTGDIAGYVTTISTAAVAAGATHVQQEAIRGSVEHAIERLESTGDPVQMEKAQALRDANRPDGLKGMLHSDAIEYNAERTLDARNQVLSEKSVIGGKLSRDIGKVSDTLDFAESVGRKAGIVGMAAGPLIGGASEIAKLDENATTAETVTAGIVGSLKTVDNAVVGGVVGALTGIVAGISGPGAIAAATAGGMAAEAGYKELGGDEKFDTFIDNTVAPVVQTGVGYALDAVDAASEAVDDTVEATSEAVDNAVDTVSDWFNDWFGSPTEPVQR